MLPEETPAESSHSVRVPGDGGFLQLRVVPDDNSCLFSAVALVFEGGIESAQQIRKSELPPRARVTLAHHGS